MPGKALIAMSGGVDSSVAAYLVKKSGYEVAGATMRLYDNYEKDANGDGICLSLKEIEDARKIAEKLEIPFHILDFRDKFDTEVIESFVRSYETGATPNPCIECNRRIKFGSMMKYAIEQGYDILATGHYARVEFDLGSERYLLKCAADDKKDQSYVLYSLTQYQLSHVLFPLGGLNKTEARAIAEEQFFFNAEKKESQDICFVPDGDYAAFICDYSGKDYPPGDFIDREGNILGKHKGIIRYTIGQRKGLGLSLPHPMYVCGKDILKNNIVLGKDQELFKSSLEAENFNWIACDIPLSDIIADVKIRYSHKADRARIIPIGKDQVRIEFDTPQRAVTKGQSAVLYDGDIVVGGGTIR